MRKLLLLLGVTLFSCMQLLAQQRTITGKVTDANGAPVSNATVQVRQSTVGTTTKADGTFTLTIPATAKTLIVSSIGFAQAEIGIGGNSSFAISLSSANTNLEDVVVTGIKTTKKSEYAGAATHISPKAIEDKPVGSFDQLLQGQVPGVLDLTSSGQPGTSATVILRGSTSISGGVSPLYIVDGIPVEAGVFQGLNPNDFASIDVLRDASASALYGSRGSAGVIVITTKRGVAGQMKLAYSGQMGVKNKPEFAFKPMNTARFLQAQHDYGQVLGIAGNSVIPGWYYAKDNPRYATLTPTQQSAADAALDSISKINTNWADYIFRNGPFSNHQISLSGGTGKTRTYNSLEMYDETGTTYRTDMKRIALRSNIDYTDDKFNFSLSSDFAYVKRDFQQSTANANLGNPFLIVNVTAPTSKVYNPDGTYAVGTGNGFAATNTLDLTARDLNYSTQIKANIGVTSSYKITNFITAALTTGIDYRETQASNYGSKLAYVRIVSGTPTGTAGFQLEGFSRYFSPDIRPSLSFSKIFAEKHKVDVGVYTEYVAQFFKTFNMQGFGIDPRTPNTPAAITQGNGTNQLYAVDGGSKSQNATVSALAIGTYTYNEKYTVTGSYRRDGSSKLPVATREQDFYSIGGIWNASRESFLEHSNFVNNLRVRLSYGGSGNSDNFPNAANSVYSDFTYLTTFSAAGNYAGLGTLSVVNYGNPQEKWEKTYVLNLGADFSLVKNRVYGSVDVYDKRTKDLFVQKQLTAEGCGLCQIAVNAGEMQNKGVEAIVNIDVVKVKNLTWTVSGNVAYNKNKVLSLGGLASYPAGTSLVTVGLPLNSNYTVKWAGVDPATGAPLYIKADGKTVTTIYSAADQVQQFGTSEAPWKGGFGSDVRYKGFDLSVLFSWQQGAIKSDNLQYFVENPVGFLANGYNQSSSLNFWKKPGDIATTPSPFYGTNFTSELLHDASFLRLRDVTFSYLLPSTIISRLRYVSKVRFYVQGTNLFIWTKWRGMDPEAGAININLNEYPNPRAFTGGLDITF